MGDFLKPRKDLLDIESLNIQEINYILENAIPFKQLFKRSVKKVPILRGRTVLNLFYEPSTRTSSSFEVAAKRLSADITNFMVSSSSINKGESLLDTIETLQSMRSDYVVIRHKSAGVPEIFSKNTDASVINAGDGNHAHPTQALLDAMTFKEVFSNLKDKKMVIVGDVNHSRVARSTSNIMKKLGVKVSFFGPGSLIPDPSHSFIGRLLTWEDVFKWKPDVIYLLRMQLERQRSGSILNLSEYHKMYGVTDLIIDKINKLNAYIMHPGPINRGIEITDKAMKYKRNLIKNQVENGIAIRMSVLHWLRPRNNINGKK